MAAKIRKGDKVIVISGRDKGKRGEVIRVYPEDERVLVSGVNMIKRHQRQSMTQQAGIISKEAPLHRSKIAHVDPKTSAPTRIGFKTLEGGNKVRYAKKTGEVLTNE